MRPTRYKKKEFRESVKTTNKCFLSSSFLQFHLLLNHVSKTQARKFVG
jgi:hypothetical protein